jgi:hypothetical protein
MFSMWFVLLFLVLINNAKTEVYKLDFYGTGNSMLEIGTPQQKFFGTFRVNTDKFLVEDSSCGVRASNCPKYCDSKDFSPAYCHPLCGWDLGPRTKALYCLDTARFYQVYPYNASGSSTFEDTNVEWREWSSEFQPHYGRLARDTIELLFTKNKTAPAFNVKNVTFGRILLRDGR